MERITLDGEFLKTLNTSQRGLLWEYYRLTTTPSSAPELELEQLAQIWEQAENDLVLSRWLQVIDHFYTNVSDLELPSDEQRAYFGEYVLLLAQPHVEAPNSQHLNHDGHLHESQYCVFVCPDGSGYVLKPMEPGKPMNCQSYLAQRCEHCKQPLSQHFTGQFSTPG